MQITDLLERAKANYACNALTWDQTVKRELGYAIEDCETLEDVKSLLQAYWWGHFDL